MTTLDQTQRRVPSSPITRLVLAGTLVAGIAGLGAAGLVGSGLLDGRSGGELSPRDQAVLQAARDWEARYRQMYPGS